MSDNGQSDVAALWRRLYRGEIAEEEVFAFARRHARITMVSLNCSAVCNLACRHCFYGFDTPTQPLISLPRWREVIDAFAAMGVRHFHISGKEPLLADVTFGILGHLRSKRETLDVHYGLITNGTCVCGSVNLLRQSDLDYIDFSIDGPREVHDWLRGPGAYDAAISGLHAAVEQRLARTIYVSSVAHLGNADSLAGMIEQLARTYGVRDFFVQPLQPHGRGADLAEVVPGPEAYSALVDSLARMLQMRTAPAGLRLVLFVPQTYSPGLLILNPIVGAALAGYFSSLDTERRVGESTLAFRFHMTCLSFWRTVQITPDGYYIGCSMALCVPNYHDYAVGNIATAEPAALYKESVRPGGLLERLLAPTGSSPCAGKECAKSCFGGCRMMAHSMNGTWGGHQLACFGPGVQRRTEDSGSVR